MCSVKTNDICFLVYLTITDQLFNFIPGSEPYWRGYYNKYKDSEKSSQRTRGQITQEMQNGHLCHSSLAEIPYDLRLVGQRGWFYYQCFGFLSSHYPAPAMWLPLGHTTDQAGAE